MKKIYLMLSLALTICLSCAQQNGEVSVETLRAQVVQNKNFIAYSKAQNDLALMALNRESSFKNADMRLVQTEIKNAKTLEEAKAVLKKAGVQGGDKMATLMYNMNQSLFKLFKEIPQLGKLSRDEFATVMKVNRTITNEDIKKSADIILSQDQ